MTRVCRIWIWCRPFFTTTKKKRCHRRLPRDRLEPYAEFVRLDVAKYLESVEYKVCARVCNGMERYGTVWNARAK